MTYFMNWIKGIASFYIVSSIILNALPSVKYKKYIKLFVGIITIILSIKPIGGLFKMEEYYDTSYYNEEYNILSEELKAELSMADEKRYELIAGEYVDIIKERIGEYVESIGADYVDSDITINYTTGEISGISLWVKRGKAYKSQYVDKIDISIKDEPEEEMLSIEIKNYLSSYYGTEKRNIDVIFE